MGKSFKVFIWVAIFGILFAGVLCSSQTSAKQEVKLKASVNFDGYQFKIVNKNDFVWKNVDIKINWRTKGGGYTYKSAVNFIPNGKYTIGASMFAKRDGTRFNPLQTKPQTVVIQCDTEKGKGIIFFGND
jgi:hypothetical protein